jgi:hypothetical protein
MKAFTTKEFVSLAVIVVTAPVLALAVAIGASAMVHGNGLFLLALTLCGAVVSGINGFGRRTAKCHPIAQQPQRATFKRGPHIMSLTP